MPKTLLIGLVILAFASGIGFGLFLSDPPSSTGGAATARSPSAGSASSLSDNPGDPLESRLHDLESQLAERKKKQEALITTARLNFFTKHHVQIYALDNNLKINSEISSILNLSTGERQAVERDLAGIQAEIQKLQDAKKKLVQQTGDSVTYEIPAFPDEAKELEAKFNASLSADLGENRAALFKFYSQDVVSSQLADFGSGKVNVSIKRTGQTDQIGSYEIKETIFETDANFERQTRISSSADYPDPQLFQRFAKLLPANSSP